MGRNKAPSENTVRMLCSKSAGICEFEGCNKRLFFDGVTLSKFNNAYVGVGIVTEPSQSAKSITFPEDGIQKKLSELSLQGDYLYSSEDPDSEEHIVKVKWIHTVNKQEAINETGFFCNQNIVCRSKNNRWDFTVSRLKELWNITD